MTVNITIPDAIQHSLESQFGPNLASVAKQTLAISWYQSEKLSIGQVAEFLDISIYEAEGLMKVNHVDSQFTVDDYNRDRETLDRLLK